MDTVFVVASAAVAMIAIERLAPNVRQPRVQGWIPRLLTLNALQIGIVFLGVVTWDRWLPRWQLLDGDRLPAPLGIALGYFAITFVYYWWHRARHEVPLLWRCLHQVHHSPVRIECAMSFYKHPAEILLNGLLSSWVLHGLVGLPPTSAVIVVTITGLAELFYHWNVRTPYWLGFVFQRPEMHRLHHARDWHRSNYSDLPVWDLLFGTFDNPRSTPAVCGFAEGAERRLFRLLMGRTPQ